MTVDEIHTAAVDAINGVASNGSWMILTGGEPGLQVDDEFIDFMHERGWKPAIETNGSVALPEGMDWITVGPNVTEHAIRQKHCDEVKYVRAHDQMVVLRGVRFTSLCEHHLLPFVGTATVGYVPGNRVVGLSKLTRLVECFARRLQIQERLTEQIATALMEHARALGAGVIVRAHHSCMGCRGVRQTDSEMVTSSMLGVMRDTAFLTPETAFIGPENADYQSATVALHWRSSGVTLALGGNRH